MQTIKETTRKAHFIGFHQPGVLLFVIVPDFSPKKENKIFYVNDEIVLCSNNASVDIISTRGGSGLLARNISYKKAQLVITKALFPVAPRIAFAETSVDDTEKKQWGIMEIGQSSKKISFSKILRNFINKNVVGVIGGPQSP